MSTKGVLSKCKTKLIGTEGERLLREKRVKGRPTGAKAPRRLPDRPRKASAWSGNQRSKFFNRVAPRRLGRQSAERERISENQLER
ncbi:MULTISPECIES: hypothetical protein [Peribacillus]|uniref:hypothetical protein n=1 Tax=Peribacillus TaxID=2675229 RepID=UPI001F4E4EEF|nr:MULTISPECIES: hypothetical protein [unclassified Peribacillus]MCK1985613.1 hypothetical protein [Peribacillus sp. Aquil_B1]MCK2009371.1 hypothetical protein [Peribacillus sp. Aquil_B8]